MANRSMAVPFANTDLSNVPSELTCRDVRAPNFECVEVSLGHNRTRGIRRRVWFGLGTKPESGNSKDAIRMIFVPFYVPHYAPPRYATPCHANPHPATPHPRSHAR